MNCGFWPTASGACFEVSTGRHEATLVVGQFASSGAGVLQAHAFAPSRRPRPAIFEVTNAP